MERVLSSDCSRCFGLCCVALPYGESADFPKDKPSGVPCENLLINNDCQIHDQLKNCGFKGCVTYECFGAGQYVSEVIYSGDSWRVNKDLADDMFTVFPIVQQIHEMLFYLAQALEVAEDKHKHPLSTLQDELLEQTSHSLFIRSFNISDYRGRVGILLEEVSLTYRKAYRQKQLKSNYIGIRISGSLAGQSLRGKLLIGANGNDANFHCVDFLGADMRDTQVKRADLSDALFLTQSQLNAAIGDNETIVPSYLVRPKHWVE
ncbi:pentapeptide repeat-containing protein [Shouchella lehensis]|uniref:Pentapeptide repeat-containing protein n=1 Tax=Shouchella lehensis TaxID=300825 RepID=A0A4Y7WET4_9BACI|nr:pentapeptide repeat-containing protein [Shouchella lehensis]MBG9784872.1 hypothetical protein [Shouchella lehensis]TES46286.1 pentapeptide repeat-containing protein [Shouchella lehensis]